MTPRPACRALVSGEPGDRDVRLVAEFREGGLRARLTLLCVCDPSAFNEGGGGWHRETGAALFRTELEREREGSPGVLEAEEDEDCEIETGLPWDEGMHLLSEEAALTCGTPWSGLRGRAEEEVLRRAGELPGGWDEAWRRFEEAAAAELRAARLRMAAADLLRVAPREEVEAALRAEEARLVMSS